MSESDTAYTFEATVPGLSVFAIGSKKQATTTFDVTSASVSATTVDIAEDFQVTAEIENTGNYNGTFDANLVVDGAVEETQSVEIPAGESREVTFTWELVGAGDHKINVNDASAGTVNVRAQETTTTTTTTPPTTTTTTSPPTTTTPDEPRGPVSTPTIAFAVVLLAVLAAGAFFLYRQGYFD